MRACFGVIASCLFYGPVFAQTCLPINHIEFQGALQFSSDEQSDWADSYVGSCLGLAQFDEILTRVTQAYVDRGYILSRAYLPEQDLSSGRLKVKVVEGKISTILFNNREQLYWSEGVFPQQVGAPANIREIEQGLDQIQAMPRWQAQMEFEPDEQIGQSTLKVAATTAKQLEFKIKTNNQGNKQTGLWLNAIEASATHLLGLNETWTFSRNKSVGENPWNIGYRGDQNQGMSFDLSFPRGRWTFDYGLSYSKYNLTIPGAISPIATNGKSRTFSFETQYLTHRDQKSKTHLGAKLTRADNQNYIQGVLIENSSRVLSNIRLTMDHERPIFEGQAFEGALKASIHMERGLPFWRSERSSEKPEGTPNAQYVLWGGLVDYSKVWESEAGALTWSSVGSLQYSGDRLYGGQLFTLGGSSTVRGTKTALTSGSSGLFWRNELDYKFPKEMSPDFTTRFYTGIDFGILKSTQSLGRRPINQFMIQIMKRRMFHVSKFLANTRTVQ